MAASVAAAYRTLKDLANKDQNGFVTPTVFNNFAQIAQLRIFNRLFDELKDAKRLSRAQFNPGRDKSRFKRIEEDLSYFAKTAIINKANGVFDKTTAADDVARIISLTTNGSVILGQSTRTAIDMCYDEDKIERILISDLSKPTENAPVALVSENIEVFPDSINSIRMRYYKYPQGVTSAGARTATPPTVVVDANDTPLATSTDFELPDHYLNDIVMEMAQLIGINLRDQFAAAAAQGEQTERKQESTF
jgi:hypothetical protein